jgi:hypothetical protein
MSALLLAGFLGVQGMVRDAKALVEILYTGSPVTRGTFERDT